MCVLDVSVEGSVVGGGVAAGGAGEQAASGNMDAAVPG